MRYFLSHKASMTGSPTRAEARDREGGPENTADLSGMPILESILMVDISVI